MPLTINVRVGRLPQVVIVPPDPDPTFVYGQSLPSDNGVGSVDETTMTSVVTTDTTISGNNQVIKNTWFQSFVKFTGSGNRLENCLINGRPLTTTTNGNGLVNFNGTQNNVVFKSEIAPTTYRGNPEDAPRSSDINASALMSVNATAGTGVNLDQTYIWGMNDSVFLSSIGENTVKGCRFDYMRFLLDDGSHGNDLRVPGWSHNDHIQWRAGTMHILGNEFMGRFHPKLGDGADAAGLTVEGKPKWWNLHNIIINPAVSTPLSGEVEYNWFWGGENAILGTTSGGATTGHSVIIRGNRICPNQCITYGSHHEQTNWQTTYGFTNGAGADANVYWIHPDTPAGLRGNAMPFTVTGTSFVSRLD